MHEHDARASEETLLIIINTIIDNIIRPTIKLSLEYSFSIAENLTLNPLIIQINRAPKTFIKYPETINYFLLKK